MNTDELLSICKFISIALTGFFGVLALVRPYRDKEGQLTNSGRVALSGVVVSFIIAALSQSLELQRAQRQALGAQMKTQGDLARFERLLHEVQRTSPLTTITLRLVVEHVPNGVRDATAKALGAAQASTLDPEFVDRLEHYNAGPDDARALIQSEMNKRAVQPFINWLAADRLSKEQSVLAFSLDGHFSALLPVGWVGRPEIFADQRKSSSLPSGVLIGDEIEWLIGDEIRRSWATPEPTYTREKLARPRVFLRPIGDALVLTIEAGVSALDDSLLRYSPNSATSAAVPDEVSLLSWSPQELPEYDEPFNLPFDTGGVHENLKMLSRIKPAPVWLRHMRLKIIPNNNAQLAKTYELSLSSQGELWVGTRRDQALGYVRLWRGRAL